jgi:hypothetical protein
MFQEATHGAIKPIVQCRSWLDLKNLTKIQSISPSDHDISVEESEAEPSEIITASHLKRDREDGSDDITTLTTKKAKLVTDET